MQTAACVVRLTIQALPLHTSSNSGMLFLSGIGSCSATDSAYSYAFLRSAVCRLSSVCHTRASCLKRSTNLDAIWQVQWHIVLAGVPLTTRDQCCCPWPWSLALACPRGQILSLWPWPWRSRLWPWPWPWAKVLGLDQPGPWPCKARVSGD